MKRLLTDCDDESSPVLRKRLNDCYRTGRSGLLRAVIFDQCRDAGATAFSEQVAAE